ncbi:MAG: EI24 domain-containing protein [Gammaproteobacteria bacterium]
MIANFVLGIKYFLGGFESIRQPGIRRYAILPILVNILLFSAGIYVLGDQFNSLMAQYLPDSESYWIILVYLLWIIFGLLILIIVFFSFTLLANLLGAPFNGPLAAAILSGELRKWLYYLFWAIPLLIISFVPVINIASPFLWFIFGGWMMAIEYMDYPMGNHNYTFPAIKNTLRQHRMLSLGFGTAVMAFTMIPFINLVVMPAAVAGASKLWVKEIKDTQ